MVNGELCRRLGEIGEARNALSERVQLDVEVGGRL